MLALDQLPNSKTIAMHAANWRPASPRDLFWVTSRHARGLLGCWWGGNVSFRPRKVALAGRAGVGWIASFYLSILHLLGTGGTSTDTRRVSPVYSYSCTSKYTSNAVTNALRPMRVTTTEKWDAEHNGDDDDAVVL